MFNTKINPTKVPTPCHKCDKRTVTCRKDCTKYKIYEIAKNAERKKQVQHKQSESDFVMHVMDNIERIKGGIKKMNIIENDIRDAIEKELISACERFPMFASLHEGCAVIFEEYQEAAEELDNCLKFFDMAWNQTRLNNTPLALSQFTRLKYAAERLAIEACQLSAMAEKAIQSERKNIMNTNIESTLEDKHWNECMQIAHYEDENRQLKKQLEKGETVDHPSHYQGKHECIEVMRALFGDEAVKGFCRCNAFKYRFRATRKNGEEDIKKAEWYEEYLMKMEGCE